MEYLRWYRRMIDVPVENDVELVHLGGDGDVVTLTLRSKRATQTVAARRVVLATGRDALGGPYTPEMFRGLDRRYVMHSMEDIDLATLRGKSIGVLGAGSTATDSAAEALEAGAARVALLVRRPDVPRINKNMGIGSAGFWNGFSASPTGAEVRNRDYVD